MPDLCPHDGDPHSCPPCQQPPTGRTLTRQPRSSRPFVAAHESTCHGCNFTVYPGQPVRYLNDRLHHARCTDA